MEDEETIKQTDGNISPTAIPKEPLHYSKEEILQCLTGEYKGKHKENSDISYHSWVIKEENIQLLCKEMEIPKSKEKSYEKIRLHDFDCELRLLKWITEDKAHRDQLVSLPPHSEQFNRFPELIPYSFNAVSFSSSENSDSYINASFIDGPFPFDHKLFISTQTPLAATTDHFWQMVLHNNVKTIITLSSEYEGRSKAESYFPDEGEKIVFGKSTIENTDPWFQLIEKCLIYRQFKVTNEETKREAKVGQVHVTCWDEHTTIKQAIEIKIMEFLFNYVDECSPFTPCVVQCNNGTGRTGTFIALYHVYKFFKAQKKEGISPNFINVFNIVRKLREQRYGMISDTVHYRCIYRLSIELLRALH